MTMANGQKERTCSDCQHAYIGTDGLFCMTFHEIIPDEKVAMECVAFQEGVISSVLTEWGAAPIIKVSPESVTAAAAEIKALARRPEVAEVVPEPPAPELVATCDEFLKSRHCTLWGEVFEVISPKGRAQAALWLAEQITAITDRVTSVST